MLQPPQKQKKEELKRFLKDEICAMNVVHNG